MGATKLLDSLESTKQHLARLLTGAGAAPPKPWRGGGGVSPEGRACTKGAYGVAPPFSGEGLLRPEASSRNGPSSKCARRTRTCMKKGLGD